jgi:hypothetical protein
MVCVAKFILPLKDHKVNGNDIIYEMNEDTLSGINFIIATLQDNE